MLLAIVVAAVEVAEKDVATAAAVAAGAGAAALGVRNSVRNRRAAAEEVALTRAAEEVRLEEVESGVRFGADQRERALLQKVRRDTGRDPSPRTRKAVREMVR